MASQSPTTASAAGNNMNKDVAPGGGLENIGASMQSPVAPNSKLEKKDAVLRTGDDNSSATCAHSDAQIPGQGPQPILANASSTICQSRKPQTAAAPPTVSTTMTEGRPPARSQQGARTEGAAQMGSGGPALEARPATQTPSLTDDATSGGETSSSSVDSSEKTAPLHPPPQKAALLPKPSEIEARTIVPQTQHEELVTSAPVQDANSQSKGSSGDTAAQATVRPVEQPKATQVAQRSAPPSASRSAPSPPPPLKSLTMTHLSKKYISELQFMQREFRKLERQLLGAKVSATADELPASRERREKLHSFILHLEDTIRQIEAGARREAEGKSSLRTDGVARECSADDCSSESSLSSKDEEAKKEFAKSAALSKLTKEKEQEETVQRLEEHILASLLPVKVRLTKQLAAQQGATRNPAGISMARRGFPQSTMDKGKGTFAAAAEERRRQADALRQQQAASSCKESPTPQTTQASQTQTQPEAPTQQQPQPPSKEDTQFGQPLAGGGSSLTQKLHGPTLGSKDRPSGHGVGSAAAAEEAQPQAQAATDEATDTNCSSGSTPKRKILYAGMALGSEQVESGLSAAAGAHEMVIESDSDAKAKEPTIDEDQNLSPPELPPPLPPPNVAKTPPIAKQPEVAVNANPVPNAPIPAVPLQPEAVTKPSPPKPPQPEVPKQAVQVKAEVSTAPKVLVTVSTPPKMDCGKRKLENPHLTEQERQTLERKTLKRRKRRKRRQRSKESDPNRQQGPEKQQSSPSQVALGTEKGAISGNKRSRSSQTKNNPNKRGPKPVEYICALCNETYSSTCDANPWWALTSHDCPKCGKKQIPRIDINATANAIEYHPALLAHADDGTGAAAIIPTEAQNGSDRSASGDSESDFMEEDDSEGSDSEESTTSVVADEVENEDFGQSYAGPKFDDYDAARLLVLLGHASTCRGRHCQQRVRNVCNGIKYLMLHVRDCPGTTSLGDVCPFPWCRKVKHLLYHLLTCTDPTACAICSPSELSPALVALMGLNRHRRGGTHLATSAANTPVHQEASPTVTTSSSRGGIVVQGHVPATSDTTAIQGNSEAQTYAEPSCVPSSSFENLAAAGVVGESLLPPVDVTIQEVCSAANISQGRSSASEETGVPAAAAVHEPTPVSEARQSPTNPNPVGNAGGATVMPHATGSPPRAIKREGTSTDELVAMELEQIKQEVLVSSAGEQASVSIQPTIAFGVGVEEQKAATDSAAVIQKSCSEEFSHAAIAERLPGADSTSY